MPLIDYITGPEGKNGTPSSDTYFFVFNWLPGFLNNAVGFLETQRYMAYNNLRNQTPN